MLTLEELIEHACHLAAPERQRLVAAVEASLVAEVLTPADADHAAWAAEMQELLQEFRHSAAGYSETEIDQIVDAAVEAVRRGQRPGNV
ncbi:MAG: hypothetical protein HOP18_16285 [Deltaproteobacteria bacterium]|nr:hypothetical protein [Deltaproteobacteria bacterium]